MSEEDKNSHCKQNSPLITKEVGTFLNLVKQGKSLLAIDYGTKKTGLAISDPGQKIALPLLTIFESDLNILITKITELVLNKKIFGIVIGLPLTMENTKAPITEKAENLATNLLPLNNPILLYDERFSSKAARNLLKIHGIKETSIRETNDQVAACLMLAEILESRRIT
jgi:putative Holliday junction resolvase